MPQVYLSSFGGVGAKFFSNNSMPLAGGKVRTYLVSIIRKLAFYGSRINNSQLQTLTQ